MLELDYTNVLEEAVHNHGIPKIAFQKAADSSKHVVEAIHQAHTSGKLGFGDVPSDEDAVKGVVDFAQSHAYPNVLLLGIGGSALGPAALDAGLNRRNSRSEERRVGKECRSRWWAEHYRKENEDICGCRAM